MKILYSTIIVFLFFLFLLPTRTISAGETMTIAVHNYPPFYAANGQGMMVDIYKAAGRAVGLEVTIKVLPIRRGLKMLFSHEIDAFSPGQIFMSPEQVKMSSSIPTTFYALVGFAYHNPQGTNRVQLTSFEDLRGKKVGFIIGSPQIPLAKQHGLLFEEKKDAMTHLKMLKGGRFDFTEITLLGLLVTSQRLFGTDMKEFDFVKQANIACSVAFSNSTPRSATLQERFAKGMEIIKKNGEYIRIAENYWGKNNIQKDALPDDLVKFGVDNVDIDIFKSYRREPWGEIKRK